MTARQRQATGGATATLTMPTPAGSSHDRIVSFSWEDWFKHASSQQRAAALVLAHQQGILYPHQLPATTNGVKPIATPPKDSEVSKRLSAILDGGPEKLPALQFQSINVLDADLDRLQQEAVTRAISTPDVFLLQGLPGTGKSRVLAEIALQAAARGGRVLLLGAHAASIDVVLERLVGRSELLPLRFLDTTEKPEALPAWLHRFTLEEQRRAFSERL